MNPRPRQGVVAKKPKGPPAKITLDRLQQIVAYVSNGLDLTAAAKAVGVHANTIYGWNRRGRLELTRVEDETGEDPYEAIPTTDPQWPTTQHWTAIPPHFDPVEWAFVVFCVAVEKAQSSFEARALTVIQGAMSQSWQAAAWLLERKYPERYGRAEARLKVTHDGHVDSRVEISVVSAADIEARFREIEADLPEIDGEVIDG